jgi:hypothetical protein
MVQPFCTTDKANRSTTPTHDRVDGSAEQITISLGKIQFNRFCSVMLAD